MIDPNQIVYVKWVDALQHDVVEQEEEMPSTTVSHIVGFLLRSDESGVVISQEWIPGIPSFKNAVAIPRGMVIKEVVLSQSPEWPLES
jgi:hypothetical protein